MKINIDTAIFKDIQGLIAPYLFQIWAWALK